MGKLVPSLIEEVFLEILKPAYFMVAGQYGLGRDGLFRADCLFTEQADCIVGLESNPQGSILRWQSAQAAFLR